MSLVLGSIWPAQGSQGGSGPSLQGRRAGLRQRSVRNGQSARSLLGPQLREQREGSRARGRGRPRPPQGRPAAPPSLSAAQDLTAGRAGTAGPLRGRGWGSAVSGAWSESALHCPLRQHFDTDTQDLAGIEWAPNGCVLAAWDTCLEVRRPFPRAPGAPPAARALHAASAALTPVPAGSPCSPSPPACPAPRALCRASLHLLQVTWPFSAADMSPPQYKVLLYSLDGRLLSAYCAYEWSLGVKAVAWSPSSQFLAVGSYDGKVGPGAAGSATARRAGGGPHRGLLFRCAS